LPVVSACDYWGFTFDIDLVCWFDYRGPVGDYIVRCDYWGPSPLHWLVGDYIVGCRDL